jgi:hypothetical protein
MAHHPEVLARRAQISAQLIPLFIAAVNAARECDAQGVKLGDMGQVLPFKEDSLSPGQREAISALTKSRTDFDNSLDEIVLVASQHLAAVAALPRTVYDACVQVAAFQIDYETAANDALAKLNEWSQLDVLTGRTRADVVRRLMSAEGGGMSATAADKAASGDEQYTSHKDAVAAAAVAKDTAALLRDISYEKLKTARTILSGLVQVTEARAGRPQVVLEPAPSGADARPDAPQKGGNKRGARGAGPQISGGEKLSATSGSSDESSSSKADTAQSTS